MNHLGLIIKREYVTRIRKKSFLLLTILMPFLMAALIFVPLWLSSIKDNEAKQVAVIDQTAEYAPLFKDTPAYHFVQVNQDLETYRTQKDKSFIAFIDISDDLLTHPEAITIYSDKQVPKDLSDQVTQLLNTYLKDKKMASYKIPGLKKIIKDSNIHLNIRTIKWEQDGTESESSSTIASIIGVFFTMLVYMFILIYGAMVMQAVTEEKTSRIIEILVSSVKPFQLMLGKIIGIGFVGLTQLFLWGIMIFALMGGIGLFFGIDTGMMTASNPMAIAGPMTIQPEATQILSTLNTINWPSIVSCFVLFFIGGYLLYSSFFAAVGSAVESQEDTGQFMMPVTLLLVFALYAGIYSIENPDGPLAFWCSLIPLTSPIVMMIRLPFDVPTWQIGLSLVILFGTALGNVWISGRIYRIGILMYGKKSSIKEILKWIRYKGD